MVKFSLNEEILDLYNYAESKQCKFYLVGGFVRDSIIGRKCVDIDSTGSLTLRDVVKYCQNLGLNYVVKSQELEVVSILFKSGINLEYARMRTEIYGSNTSHNPKVANFTNSEEEDSLRRDFSINALYLNPITLEIKDYHNGLCDLENKTIRMIKTQNGVSLDYDPERILRMIELHLRTGFLIEPKTMAKAIENLNNVKSLSVKRMQAFLQKIKIYDLSSLDDNLLNMVNEIKLMTE